MRQARLRAAPDGANPKQKMPDYDFDAQRLYLDAPFAEGAVLALEANQANYLKNVLRLQAGDVVLVFNGRDGEWLARLSLKGKRDAALELERCVRDQTPLPDVWYVFAPIKHARLDYMVQKAVEMGAGRLVPVMTRRTQATRVNLERMQANVIEAAEQCGIMAVPDVAADISLERLLDGWDPARRLVFCDEAAEVINPIEALGRLPRGPLAVLIGPEGGFDDTERARLLRLPFVTAIALGPRILRADTAGIAALGVVQAVLGDWGGTGTP